MFGAVDRAGGIELRDPVALAVREVGAHGEGHVGCHERVGVVLAGRAHDDGGEHHTLEKFTFVRQLQYEKLRRDAHNDRRNLQRDR